MQDQPARREHPVAFAQQPRQRLARQLVQEHGGLHPVECPVIPAREVFAIGLDKADVPDPQPRRPRRAIAQRGSGSIDGDNFRIGEGLGQRQCAVADSAADIENSPGLPVGPLFLEPGDNRLPCPVIERAERAAGGCEDADIVVGTGRNIAGALLAVIAAGLAVDIDGGLVLGLLDSRDRVPAGRNAR